MNAHSVTTSQLTVHSQPPALIITVSGDWLLTSALPALAPVLAQISAQSAATLCFRCHDLGRWQSVLVTDVMRLMAHAESQGLTVDCSGLPPALQGLIQLAHAVPERVDAHRAAQGHNWLAQLGLLAHRSADHGKAMLQFVGETVMSIGAVLQGRAHFRQADVWLNIDECGPSALPIVTLISLLVGLILAFVGALQLSLFGAQIYIANLVSLGMTREMGGLMTAIIMAGRTGAAYAAQIGTMHVNDEIDALKTMNLQPMVFLVLPRMLALIVIMPLLCLYADLLGIIGGGLVSTQFFDISLTEYLDRTASAVKLKDFLVGFVKCGVFGVLIALAGCMRGMQCGRSASAVGEAATSAVVTSIVFIVLADSLMTLICNRFGI